MTPTHQRHSHVGRQVLWITCTALLCIWVPAWLYQATGGIANSRNPWWALAVIVFAGTAYAGVISSWRRQLYAMVVWLFTYLFLGLAPYVQYRLDIMPSTTLGANEALFPMAAGLIIAAGTVFLLCGAAADSRRTTARAVQPVPVDQRKANILTIMALGLFAYYANTVGFSSFFLSRTDFVMVKRAMWPNSTFLAAMTGAMNMGLLVAFLAQMAVRHQMKAKGIRAPILPALTVALVLLFVSNPISSPRSGVGTLFLSMIAAFGAYATLNRFRAVSIIALVGMITVFPLADLFRHSTDATLKVEGPVLALTSGDFDSFMQIVNSLDYVSAQGITWGHQLLGVFLLWVPRSIWPGKAEDTGVVLAEYMEYTFTNLSAPFWAEMNINFGWLGILAGMGVLGYWFRVLDNRTERHLRLYSMPPVVVCATAFYMLIFLRGSMLAVSAHLLVILLASWYVTRTSSTLRRRRVHAPAQPYREFPPQLDGRTEETTPTRVM